MSVHRRQFLLFLGGATSSLALGSLQSCQKERISVAPTTASSDPETAPQALKAAFQPIRGTIPLETDGISPTDRIAAYQTYEVADDLVLPEGFTYQVVAAWGDRLGDSRVGYNNDYLSYIETQDARGYLTVNFEYISGKVWQQTYPIVLQETLPFAEVKAAVGDKGIDAYALPEGDRLKTQIQQICTAALIDQGLGVMSVTRSPDGSWTRTNSDRDRRVTGISGLNDDRYLNTTGPASAVFRKTKGMGYLDSLGDRIIGTFANCAGGTTPWGTVLSAEENFQAQVPEPVYPDGTSVDPSRLPFFINDNAIFGQGNPFGLAGNKYGWIVEIDPDNPNDYGTKHTWLGRYRHEAVGVRVEAGKPLAFYSGCDRHGGHLYKFVSSKPVADPTDKANSQLLAEGTLYAAQFDPDGSGRWIALNGETRVNPQPPSQLVGNMLWLHYRPAGGYFQAIEDEQIALFQQRFAQLKDIYVGDTPEEVQGAILIDAHYAANAAGATCTARPEDTYIAPDGSLFVSFTSGGASDDGGPDKRIFTGPQGETPYPFGWIMQISEAGNDPAAGEFRWKMVATGGEPAGGGLGFANPDNLTLDPAGNLWMVTDMSANNRPVPDRAKDTDIRGIFGNDSIWYVPLSGTEAGLAYLFGVGPMECETTGPFFTNDGKTLFLAVQHPGEANGIRTNNAIDVRQFALLSTQGQEFVQTRQVPIGSNWPDRVSNAPPKPAVVAIYRRDGKAFV